jgi:hypothetical protein
MRPSKSFVSYVRAFLYCFGLLSAFSALADFPDRPLKILVGFAPGGGSDILARTVAPALGEALGQTVIVDNLPGAGGNRAMAEVARAKADGYTLLMGTPGLATNASLYSNLGFDPLTAFEPIGLIGSVQNVLLVQKDLPVSSVNELIAYIKARPGKLNYASPGTGTALHLAGELFKSAANLDIVHVPYKGGGQAMTDLMSGQVAVMFNVLPSALPQIKAGTVKALAVTGRERASVLPDLPTMIESGVLNYTAFTWNGLLAPSATPPQVILTINKAIQKILASPEMAKRYASIGTDVMSGTPDAFKKLIQDETQKWRQIIESNSLKAE